MVLRRWFSALGRCVLCALYRAWRVIVAAAPVSPLATIEIAYAITKSVQQTTPKPVGGSSLLGDMSGQHPLPTPMPGLKTPGHHCAVWCLGNPGSRFGRRPMSS